MCSLTILCFYLMRNSFWLHYRSSSSCCWQPHMMGRFTFFLHNNDIITNPLWYLRKHTKKLSPARQLCLYNGNDNFINSHNATTNSRLYHLYFEYHSIFYHALLQTPLYPSLSCNNVLVIMHFFLSFCRKISSQESKIKLSKGVMTVTINTLQPILTPLKSSNRH